MSEFVKQSTNKVELLFPSNKTNINFIGKPFLFRQNCFERKLKNQTEMMGAKLRTVQWSGINSTTCRSVNTDRCLNKGLGGNVQLNLNRGRVVCSEKEKLHKCLRTFSHKSSYTNVLKNLEAQSHSSPGGQYCSFDISVKDRGYPEFKTSPINKRNMRSSSPVWDHSYCRVPSQQTERDSRLGVKK